jgi:rare lipoprotein A
MKIAFAILLASIAILAGCGKKNVKAARRPGTTRPAAKPVKIGDTETGMASWYGHPYHGRQAANGEIYDMEKLTAAHRTMPFNTWVRVENLANHKTVEVRITDRGPFARGRVIDLSHSGAQAIDMIGPGTANVRIVVIRAPANAETALFGVQVGLFRDRANADRLQQQLQTRYGKARIVERNGDASMWRVVVGEEASPESGEALARRIRGDISVPEAFVVRIDPH